MVRPGLRSRGGTYLSHRIRTNNLVAPHIHNRISLRRGGVREAAFGILQRCSRGEMVPRIVVRLRSVSPLDKLVRNKNIPCRESEIWTARDLLISSVGITCVLCGID